MVDRVPAAELLVYAKGVPGVKITRTLSIVNDAISSTDITSRAKTWGDFKTSIFNKHPDEQGSLELPVVSINVDNTDGFFNPGGVIFPNGNSDLESTLIQLVVDIERYGSGLPLTYLDFTGNVAEPEYDETGVVTLVAEHPLAKMSRRKWQRADGVGTRVDPTYFRPLFPL